MPFTYINSKSKRRVRFERFMALYGGGKGKRRSEEYMDSGEIGARVEVLAGKFGGRIIREPKSGD